MPPLKVPYLEAGPDQCPAEVGRLLDQLPRIPISCNPWPQYGHEVKAAFAIAHSATAVLLKYFVNERFLLAAAAANGDIHKDSCVEFFVAFGNDDNYYNLEFNCIGWCKAGFGFNRMDRYALPETATDSILTDTHIRSEVVDGTRRFGWELTIVIPATVFSFHKIDNLSAMQVKGNFHKCGDELPTPHFLTWSHVTAHTPNFHRKEDFADILFL